MWITATITDKTSTGPASSDLSVLLVSDAGEKTTWTLSVTLAALRESPDYVFQQLDSKLREMNRDQAALAQLDAISVGTTYEAHPTNIAAAGRLVEAKA